MTSENIRSVFRLAVFFFTDKKEKKITIFYDDNCDVLHNNTIRRERFTGDGVFRACYGNPFRPLNSVPTSRAACV